MFPSFSCTAFLSSLFEFAFNHISRKDGVCVGIYGRKAIDQIRQNATYTETLTPR